MRQKGEVYRWMLARGVAVRNAQGNIIRFMISSVDITELKRVESELRISEQRFRTFVDHATDSFFLFDDRNVVLDVNRQACEKLGYAREELLGLTAIDFDPDVTPARLEEIQRRLDDKQTLAFESRHRRRDGTVFPVEIRGQAFWEGGRRFTVALARDITERKRAEEAMRRQAALLRLSNDAILVWRLDGGIESWSRGAEELYGFAEGEAFGRVTHELLRTVFPVPWPQIEADLRAGGSWEGELRHRTSDGRELIVSTRLQLVRDDGVWHVLESNRDITDRSRAQEALRQGEQRWRSLTEALPQLVWTATPDGACDYFSRQWTQHTGIAESDLLGWRWLETLHPDDRESTRKLWTQAVARQGGYDVEYRVRRHDRAYRWFKTRGVPIRDAEGGIFKWFGTCTDITDAKLAAEELRLAKEAAESANRAKDEFLANVSHEIRTPMNAILGMTELVLDTSLGPDQRQSLKTVKSAADNLLGIINDLLDFSKIEAGKLELDSGDFSLRAAVGDTLHALAVRAHRKGLELVCNVEQDVPDALVGDAGRLRQVLLNLVSNAVKFTERGEVVVRVELAEPISSTDDVRLRFTVRDTGIGIAPEKQAKIFRAFEQEDTSTTRKFGGTGLGLTISAQLAALMGGGISVQSELGKGSTFSFTAKFAKQPQQAGTPTDLPHLQLRNLRVLVVDDNAANRQIMEQWLRDWQMEPTAVSDGMAAMDALWHAVAVGKPYSLLLLDARMPDTDGLTLAAKIGERAELSGSRKILLTSGDRPGDLARFRELRVDAHLLKPVGQNELLETIYSVMSRTSERTKDEGGRLNEEKTTSVESGSDSSSVLHPSSLPLRVLVAEDSELNAQLMEKVLGKWGHTIRVASNGREALALANDADFDLLLLDVHMPEIDGFGVIRAIRGKEQATGSHLPVIALTARSRKEDRELCLAAGMDDFLAKPIQADDLRAAIDRTLGSFPPRRQAAAPLIDARVLLAACGGDQAILKSICETFVARLPDHLATVERALLDNDAPQAREAAHKLFGMVSAFSTSAGAVASAIEDHAALGELQPAATLLEQLKTLSRELPRAVKDISVEKLQLRP
jgi:PAS domain S-box-containing protein